MFSVLIVGLTPAMANKEPFTPSIPATWDELHKQQAATDADGKEPSKPSANRSRSRMKGKSPPERTSSRSKSCGRASWYASGSHTASGERFRPSGLTAAHRTMAFGTRLVVTDIRTKRSVLVRVNDRGPFVRSRILDLSRGAAEQLGVVGRGIADVCVSVAG